MITISTQSLILASHCQWPPYSNSRSIYNRPTKLIRRIEYFKQIQAFGQLNDNLGMVVICRYISEWLLRNHILTEYFISVYSMTMKVLV